MPYILTEPQKIEGTQLGYAIYPYQFSFEDHMQEKADRKLVIFELSKAPVIDVVGAVHEETYVFTDTHRGEIELRILKFVEGHPEYVTDKEKCEAYFSRVKQECFHHELEEENQKN